MSHICCTTEAESPRSVSHTKIEGNGWPSCGAGAHIVVQAPISCRDAAHRVQVGEIDGEPLIFLPNLIIYLSFAPDPSLSKVHTFSHLLLRPSVRPSTCSQNVGCKSHRFHKLYPFTPTHTHTHTFHVRARTCPTLFTIYACLVRISLLLINVRTLNAVFLSYSRAFLRS